MSRSFSSILCFALVFIGPIWGSEEGVDTCTAAADVVADYLLGRFLANETVQDLPKSEVAILQLSNMKLYGLNTIFRSCPISVNVADDGLITVSACIAARSIRVKMDIKASLIITSLDFSAEADIRNFSGRVEAGVRLETGQTAKLLALKVEHVDPNLEFTGPLDQIARFVNGVMQTKLKNLVVGLVTEQLKGVIQTLLNENPL